MAQSQKVHVLLTELIKSIDSRKQNVEELKRQATKAERTISCTDSPRTNQFAVYDKAKGLVEKLKILNRDDSSALFEEKFHLLDDQSWKWTPETLSLLFHLSNRPTAHAVTSQTQLEDNENSIVVSQEDEASDHVSAASDHSGLWRNTNFAAEDTSDEDDVISEYSEEAVESPLTTVSSDEKLLPVESFLVSKGPSELPRNLINPYWKAFTKRASSPAASHREHVVITETQLVREIIHMLLGLRTSIFTRTSLGVIEAHEDFTLPYMSNEVKTDVLDKFIHTGELLDLVRILIRHEERDPVVQRWQSLLQNELAAVETSINEAQAEYLNHQLERIVSVTDLYERAMDSMYGIRQLHPLLEGLHPSPAGEQSIRILNGLFEATCLAQSVGDIKSYHFTANLLFGTFQIYRRPLQVWMEEGELRREDPLTFIRRNGREVSPESIWQTQFSLIGNTKDTCTAPSFLESSLRDIFSAGRSSHLLKLLKLGDQFKNKELGTTDAMTFESVCEQPDPQFMSPFAALFEAKLQDWVSNRLSHASTILHHHLEQSWDFTKSLDALQLVYLHQNAALSNNFLFPVFNRLDSGRQFWNDPITLGDLLRSSFAYEADTSKLAVRIERFSQVSNQNTRSMASLESIKIVYRLPWLVANVVQPAALQVYHEIFVFGAQLHRARWLLLRHKLSFWNRENKAHMHRIISLRARLLHFIYTMTTHLFVLVVDTRTRTMRQQLRMTANPDEMIDIHQSYMQHLKNECILSEEHASFKQAVVSILDLTVIISDLIKQRLDASAGTKSGSGNEESDSTEDEDAEHSKTARKSDPNRHQPTLSKFDLNAKLNQVENTWMQLRDYVLASVQSLSKGYGSPCWEILASSLAAECQNG